MDRSYFFYLITKDDIPEAEDLLPKSLPELKARRHRSSSRPRINAKTLGLAVVWVFIAILMIGLTPGVEVLARVHHINPRLPGLTADLDNQAHPWKQNGSDLCLATALMEV